MRFAAILIFSTLASCGGWVERYDNSQSEGFAAQISVDVRDAIIERLLFLAKEHNFQIVVQDKEAYAKGGFNVMMRGKSHAVFCSNLPDPAYLQCGVHKARIEKHRPSGEETRRLARIFEQEIAEIDGVTLDENKVQN